MVMASLFVIFSLIGVLVGNIFRPADKVNVGKSPTLNKIVLSASSFERGIKDPIEEQKAVSFMEFLRDSIPKNIFNSLSQSEIVQVVVFSFIFALALAAVPGSERIMNFLDIIYKVFERIFSEIITFLPIASFCIMSTNITKIDPDAFLSMVPFVGYINLAYLMVFFVGVLIINFRTKLGLIKSITYFKDPTIVALATSSSLAAIPSSIRVLNSFYQNNTNLVQSLIPLGIIVGRFSICLYFAFAAIFVGHIYLHDFTLIQLFYVVLLSIFAGISTIGITAGGLLIPILAMVLDPIGLPFGALVFILTAMDPLISPMRTMIVAHSNITMSTMVIDKD
jgi:Na+/H+-dicarboxylate symporter